MGVLERIRKAKEQFAAARTFRKEAAAGKQLREAARLRKENEERIGLLEVRKDFLAAQNENKALRKEQFAGSRMGLFMAAGKKVLAKAQGKAQGRKGVKSNMFSLKGGDVPHWLKENKKKKPSKDSGVPYWLK